MVDMGCEVVNFGSFLSLVFGFWIGFGVERDWGLLNL